MAMGQRLWAALFGDDYILGKLGCFRFFVGCLLEVFWMFTMISRL